MSVPAPTAGAVYDRGYRPYDGEQGGRRAARAALYRASLRRALGLRRPWRQKVAPVGLLLIAVVPAVVNVGATYLTRDLVFSERVEFITYRQYVGVSNALLVFVGLIAPDLVCPDRRNRVLPLIFARPLTGADYVLAKVGAMATVLFAFGVIPQLVLFVGQTFVSRDGPLTYATEHADVLWKVPVAVGALALFYATISLAVSCLTARRVTAGASIVGLFLLTSIVGGVLSSPELRGADDGSLTALVSLLSIPLQIRDLVFLGEIHRSSPLSGAAGGGLGALVVWAGCVVASLAVLLVRYDEVER